MTFHIITLFPKAFDSYLGESIIARAIKEKKISVKFYNPRDFTKDKWARVDRKPYGGGPGMVLQAEPFLRAIEKILKTAKDKKKVKLIWFSPSGKNFSNEYSKKIVKKYDHVVLICGRYEGIDDRVRRVFKAEELSIGDFVLTGGELPAMVFVDVVSRQIKGVLGNFDSLEENRVSSSKVYTRPEVLIYKGKKYNVPKVLLSGNHAKIDSWKLQK